jgi:Tol biopolymer transport system component
MTFTSDRVDPQRSAKHVYRLNPDGTAVKRLTDAGPGNGSPAWSPDGSEKAFSATRDGGESEVYLMNADGTRETHPPNDPEVANGSPAWYTSGREIAYIGYVCKSGGGYGVAARCPQRAS